MPVLTELYFVGREREVRDTRESYKPLRGVSLVDDRRGGPGPVDPWRLS